MIKTISCVDCRVDFTYDHLTGTTRQRCDACRVSRKRQTDKAKSERWRLANPELQQMYSRKSHEKRKANPEYHQYYRDRHILRYGITRADLDAMIEAQDNKCAICGNGHVGVGNRLHIDHCHNSKKVRGLLCGKCNTAVGLLDDDPERAEALAAYLRR